jgi:AcrR family transcriptional regulator
MSDLGACTKATIYVKIVSLDATGRYRINSYNYILMSTKSQDQLANLSPRVARRRARTRERLLAEAARLFAAYGVDGVTLTDITEAADISRGNLYSFFDSKEELVHTIYEPMLAYVAEEMERISLQPPEVALEGLLRLHLEVWRMHPHALSVAYQVQGGLQPEHGDEHVAYSAAVRAVFERAAANKLLRVEPALALKILDTLTVPILELCRSAPDPERFFIDSLSRLLVR